MKIKLLNDGGFEGLDTLDYGKVFEASPNVIKDKLVGAEVTAEALIAAGADKHCLELAGCKAEPEGTLYFSLGHKEMEVVED